MVQQGQGLGDVAQRAESSPGAGQLFNFGNVLGNISTNPAMTAGLGFLVPGFRNWMKSPFFQSLVTQAQGQQLTNQLSQLRPNYQSVSPGESLLNLEGAGGISLQSVGEQAIKERSAEYEQLVQLGREQKDAVKSFDMNLRSMLVQGGALEQTLRSMAPQAVQTYNTAINQAKESNTQTMKMIGASLAQARAYFQEFKGDQARIREGFDNEITARLDSMGTAIDAQSRQNADEHIRAIEATGQRLTPEERATIGTLHKMDGERTKALNQAQFSESAAIVRSDMDTKLNSSLENAMSTTAISTVQLVGTAAASQNATSQLVADIQKAKQASLENIASTRKDLQQIMGTNLIVGSRQLFDMITETVRPVYAISDIMSDTLGTAWDMIAFDADLQTRTLMNEAFIQNPLHAGILDAMGMFERNRMFDRQIEQQDDALDDQFTLGMVETGGKIAAAAIAGSDKGTKTDINTTNPGYATTVPGELGRGSNFRFNAQSDVEAKIVDDKRITDTDVLDRVSKLPIYTWRYKGDEARHIGPMAQDFHEAFGFNGDDDKHIFLLDGVGVAMSSIKEIYRYIVKLENRIKELEKSNAGS